MCHLRRRAIFQHHAAQPSFGPESEKHASVEEFRNFHNIQKRSQND
jgi:hypothetical protein